MLSDQDWTKWAATNLMRGVSVQALVDAAQERGAPPTLGPAAIEAMDTSPEIKAGRTLANRAMKLEGLLRALDALMFADFDGVRSRRASLPIGSSMSTTDATLRCVVGFRISIGSRPIVGLRCAQGTPRRLPRGSDGQSGGGSELRSEYGAASA